MQQSASLKRTAQQRCFKPSLAWDPEVQEYLAGALGGENFARISDALCSPPRVTCIRANTLKRSAEEIAENLQELVSNLPPTESRERASVALHTSIPDAVLITSSGPHKIDYAASSGKEVIISRKAGEAVLRGAHVYAPGVLACSAGIAEGDLVGVSFVLDGQPGLSRGRIIEHMQALPDSANLHIGLGRARMSRRDIFKASHGIAVSMEQPVFSNLPCNGILLGDIMAQNLPSLVAAHVLNPDPGSRVCDMCAAPGGKCTAMAQIMRNRGEIIAFDRSHSKVQDIKNLAEELGVSCISAHRMDATKACTLMSQHRTSKSIDVEQQRCNVAESLAPVEAISQRRDLPERSAYRRSSPTRQGAMPPRETVDATKPANCAKMRSKPAKSDALVGQQMSGEDLTGTGRGDEQEGWEGNAASTAVQVLPLKGEAKIEARRLRKAAASLAKGQQPASMVPTKSPAINAFPPEAFNFILLDAPCSALGLRPRLQQIATMDSLRMAAKYQRRMLECAVALLKAGGCLVYSTCTINPGENEANVRFVLDKYAELSLEAQRPYLGGPGLVGQCSVSQETWLTKNESHLVQRFDPAGSLDTIGFFIAKFRKSVKV